MSANTGKFDAAGQLKQALSALRELRERLDKAENARTAPIAIVGVGCRVPGADGPDAFWELLRDGVDAISETPAGRWDNDLLYDPDPLTPGKVATRWGGYLRDIDRFDAAFFRIAPREAAQMDPQQRLLLEVAYEALEDAGQPLERLAGSRTGVFVGIHSQSNDYFLMQSADTSSMDLYSGTGTSHSVAAGRLSYLWDFRGPCVSIDTACSSSLVAVHLATQSLRRGESDLALAGGVNVLLDPTFTIAASRMQMLAADGRCKTFDAAADGFVRSEGCGVVVLKRLSDALADGDPIHAVIYGSAINQDGRSNGLTAPNGMAQQAVIQDALRDANVAPERIGYVEAHGTGTSLGDPIEVEALSAVIGATNGDDQRCLLGSAKANLGHLEGAAGVVGLIKAVLTLRNEVVPALPHFSTLNPYISLEDTRLEIPTEPVPWPSGASPRFAGVSSFGWSGTNAHVILGDPTPIDVLASDDREALDTPVLLPIAAGSKTALRALASAYSAHLRHPQSPPLNDVAFTAATRRSQLPDRLAIVAGSREAMAERLDAFVDDRPAPGIVHGSAATRPPRLVFAFPGQGGQWLGMGLRLAATEAALAEALARCSAAIEVETGWSLLEELQRPAEDSRLNEIAVVQPAIFAIQVAIAELLADWGLHPDVVIGHSLGEVAAAHVAGILSLEDAAAVICRRSRLLKRVAGRGAMGVVEQSLDDATALLSAYGERLSVAASNGPTTTVLSGDAEALDEVLAIVQARGGFARRVQVDVASHSAQVEPLLPMLEEELTGLTPRPARTGFVSTVTGSSIAGSELGASYWANNLRRPVLFAPVVADLLQEGDTAFLEISPHPVLLGALESAIQASDSDATAVGALRRGQDEAVTLREAAGTLWAAGIPVDWERIGPGRVSLPLPGYPWQRERFWFTDEKRSSSSRSYTARHEQAGGGSLLGVSLPALAHLPDSRFWQSRIEPPATTGSLTVAGVPVLHGVAATLIAGAAVRAVSGGCVEQLQIVSQPLLTTPLEVQTVLTPDADDNELRLFTRPEGEQAWDLWATARASQPSPLFSIDVSALKADMSRQIESEPGLIEIWRNEDEELLARIDPARLGAGLEIDLLDIVARLLWKVLDKAQLVMLGAKSAAMSEQLGDTAWMYVCRSGAGESGIDLFLLAEDGSAIAEFRGISLCAPDDELRRRASIVQLTDWIYTLDWHEVPVEKATGAPGSSWLILGNPGELGSQLASCLQQHGVQAELLSSSTDDANAIGRDISAFMDGERPGFTEIIDLRALDGASDDILIAAEQRWGRALALTQALARGHAGEGARLWLVTRGAQALHGPPTDPAAASLWGFGRVVANEHPEFWGGLIDLDPDTPGDDAEMLVNAVMAAGDESEIALRGKRRYVARFTPAGDLDSTALALRADGTYLITGGAGGIGLEIARSMIAAGARHLALVGRSEIRPEAVSAIAAMERDGASVQYLRGDVASRRDVDRIFEMIHREMPALRGIVHAAGVLADSMLLQQSPAGFRTVSAPKVSGAANLVEATRGQALDFLALFSSASALLGVPGQSNYAAANAVLDSYAHKLRAEGVPATSIAWGRWGDIGLAIQADSAASLDRLGILPMPPAAGVAAFDRLVSGGAAHAAVLDIDWSTYLGRSGHVPARFTEIAKRSVISAQAPAVSMRARLDGADAVEREDILLEHVRELVAAVLRFDDLMRVPPGQGFFQIGMDSLTAVELKNRLQQSLDLTLPATIAFDYPTPAALARRLHEELYSTAHGAHGSDKIEDELNGLAEMSRDELRELLDAELELLGEELDR